MAQSQGRPTSTLHCADGKPGPFGTYFPLCRRSASFVGPVAEFRAATRQCRFCAAKLLRRDARAAAKALIAAADDPTGWEPAPWSIEDDLRRFPGLQAMQARRAEVA